jgi:hypothetical protein
MLIRVVLTCVWASPPCFTPPANPQTILHGGNNATVQMDMAIYCAVRRCKCACVCMCVHVCACVCACVCMCVSTVWSTFVLVGVSWDLCRGHVTVPVVVAWCGAAGAEWLPRKRCYLYEEPLSQHTFGCARYSVGLSPLMIPFVLWCGLCVLVGWYRGTGIDVEVDPNNPWCVPALLCSGR